MCIRDRRNELRVRAELGREGVVAVGDEDLRAVAGAAECFEDLGLKKLAAQHRCQSPCESLSALRAAYVSSAVAHAATELVEVDGCDEDRADGHLLPERLQAQDHETVQQND